MISGFLKLKDKRRFNFFENIWKSDRLHFEYILKAKTAKVLTTTKFNVIVLTRHTL